MYQFRVLSPKSYRSPRPSRNEVPNFTYLDTPRSLVRSIRSRDLMLLGMWSSLVPTRLGSLRATRWSHFREVSDHVSYAQSFQLQIASDGYYTAEWGGSQEYFLALAATCWKFDETVLSEEQAATIPLTTCTAGDGLYNKMRPPLPLPWEKPCDWPILLWGGSSQVGIQAIQLAKFSGCNPIIATASPKV